MKNKNFKSILKKAIDIMLQPENDYFLLTQAIKDMHEIYFNITGFRSDINNEINIKDTMLSNGKAISPLFAGHCLFDIMRTKQFIRGLYNAIIDAKKIFNAQRLHILYAGCGPYAALAIPMTSQFSSDEIFFTVLDIHEESINHVKKIINKLDIGSYFIECKVCDASKYIKPSDRQFHILISETMQQALAKEPQVAIFLNLVPQLAQGGIIIPELVAIDAFMVNRKKEFQKIFDSNIKPERIFISRLFELSKKTVEKGFIDYPAVEIEISENLRNTLSLYLFTNITVFDKIILKENETSLTIPLEIFKNKKLYSKYKFFYETGEKPGLRWT